MLSLFKEASSSTNEAPLSMCRRLLVSSLNKGIIPDWDQFFVDLPVFNEAHDIEEVKSYFNLLTTWPFLSEIINASGTEFFFHSPTHSQRLMLSGEKASFEVPLSAEDWQLWLEILSIHFHQNWNVQNPFVSFYGTLCKKKFRISLVHGSTSPHGTSKLVLRVLAQTPHPLSSFGETSLLVDLVAKKSNILVAGSTGSGKTSLLTSLLENVESQEHLVILEDTFEIMTSHRHATRFLSGESSQTSLKSYLSYSLRLSPDRIILGEMRSHEVIPFIMAMNTGHKGLMGTIHASSAADALNRVTLLFSLYAGETNLDFDKVMRLLCQNLEYVVFMENKKVKDVIKVLGSENGIPFYESILNQERLPF